MSGRTLLIVIVASLALTVLVAWLSGGRFWFLGLPLVFGLPLLGRRKD